jgi:4-carboxymuconolactone decarboxylase
VVLERGIDGGQVVGAAGEDLWAHRRVGREIGLDSALLDRLERGEALADPTDRAVQQAARRWCRRTDRSTAEDREATRALAGLLGPPGVVELITVVGYYRLLAQLMEAFSIEPPDDTTTPGR